MKDIASNRNYLIIDGKDSRDFNLYISGDGTYLSPEKNVEEVTIPGRNGTLLFEEGTYGQSYSNVEVTYRAFIFPEFSRNIEALRSFLLTRQGYFRLEDTYHPDEFRLASFKGPLEPDMHQTLYTGEFDITFNCKPQRFLKSGEKKIVLDTTSTTRYIIFTDLPTVSKPLIRVYGAGQVTISHYLRLTDRTEYIGYEGFRMTSNNIYTDVDCDTMNVYRVMEDGTISNRNSWLILQNKDFPTLKANENVIAVSGVRQLEITPRWWTL